MLSARITPLCVLVFAHKNPNPNPLFVPGYYSCATVKLATEPPPSTSGGSGTVPVVDVVVAASSVFQLSACDIRCCFPSSLQRRAFSSSATATTAASSHITVHAGYFITLRISHRLQWSNKSSGRCVVESSLLLPFNIVVSGTCWLCCLHSAQNSYRTMILCHKIWRTEMGKQINKREMSLGTGINVVRLALNCL